MFGYHDSNRCSFDLWSPVTAHNYSSDADHNQKGYGVWEDTPYHTAVENRAFSAYAKHTQEVEDVIKLIAKNSKGYGGSIHTNDDFTSDDFRYIENELKKRYGIVAHLS